MWSVYDKDHTSEVRIKNPVGDSELFLGFFCKCLSYFTIAKISFTSILYPQLTYMIFIIYTSWDNIVDNITRDRRRPYLVKWFTKFKALAFLQRFHWHLVVISLSEMENCKIHYKHFQTKTTKSVTGGENGAMRIGSYFLSFLFKALSLTKVHAFTQ